MIDSCGIGSLISVRDGLMSDAAQELKRGVKKRRFQAGCARPVCAISALALCARAIASMPDKIVSVTTTAAAKAVKREETEATGRVFMGLSSGG
jgi:hypothetical protein